MFTDDKITEIYCLVDDFLKLFNDQIKNMLLQIAIFILFHASGYRCLKHYYLRYVSVNLRHLFLELVSYNRFVELEKKVSLPLAIFIKKVLLGECTGINILYSTPLRVCRNQRIQMHRVFSGIAVYCFFSKKPAINLQKVTDNQLTLF